MYSLRGANAVQGLKQAIKTIKIIINTCKQQDKNRELMTKFIKGKSGNEKGRKKGVCNRSTTELKSWITSLIDQNREQLEKDLIQLEPQQRWQIIEKLMQYTTPKMQSVEARLELENLTNEQIENITQSILNQIQDDNINEGN
jgi:hypothetical protein